MSEVVGQNEEQSVKERPLRSPCISVCVLNDDDICVGCYRTGNEITHWGSCDNDERRAVLERCRERGKKLNPFL